MNIKLDALREQSRGDDWTEDDDRRLQEREREALITRVTSLESTLRGISERCSAYYAGDVSGADLAAMTVILIGACGLTAAPEASGKEGA